MVMGITSPLLLAGCAVAILLVSVAGWWLLKPEQKSRIIQVIPLAPLGTPVVKAPAITSEAPVEAAGAAEISDAEPPAAPTEAQADLAQAKAAEQALGFPLPIGSVNSITHEGVASRLVIPKLNLDAPIVISPRFPSIWTSWGICQVMLLRSVVPSGQRVATGRKSSTESSRSWSSMPMTDVVVE
jgi:hypothetical protein